MNDRTAYDVYLPDGTHLGYVWYIGPSNPGGGERWGAKDPDGQLPKGLYGTSSEGHYRRSGACDALMSHHLQKVRCAERNKKLDEIGIEIIGGHYWYGQKRVMEKIMVANSVYDKAITYRDRHFSTGDWSAIVYGNGKKLVGYDNEYALLEAAIELLNKQPTPGLDEYNKAVQPTWRVNEEYTPGGLHYKIGHSSNAPTFSEARDALAFMLGELTILADTVKDALKGVK